MGFLARTIIASDILRQFPKSFEEIHAFLHQEQIAIPLVEVANDGQCIMCKKIVPKEKIRAFGDWIKEKASPIEFLVWFIFCPACGLQFTVGSQ